LRENHSMEDYIYNINLIKNDNRKYLEDETRVPSRDATRECPFFEESCSDIDTEYSYQAGSFTWEEARDHCALLGMEIAFVNDAEENLVIGMLLPEEEDSWAWIGNPGNSADNTYSNFLPNRGVPGNAHPCARIFSNVWGSYDDQWDDHECDTKGPVVCERETKLNIVKENQAGSWGGSCTCPDGSVYQVGDNDDYCGSLACVGGISGECNESDGPWSGRKVTCAGSFRRRSLKY